MVARQQKLAFRSGFEVYNELDFIEEGATGRVYRAEGQDGVVVAVKVLKPEQVT